MQLGLVQNHFYDSMALSITNKLIYCTQPNTKTTCIHLAFLYPTAEWLIAHLGIIYFPVDLLTSPLGEVYWVYPVPLL